MQANWKMRLATAVLSSAIISAGLIAAPAMGATKTVSSRPTVASMAPGETVLFDDKSCPAGMIAQFTKAKKRPDIKKKCVHM